jgi:hypothetical protein
MMGESVQLLLVRKVKERRSSSLGTFTPELVPRMHNCFLAMSEEVLAFKAGRLRLEGKTLTADVRKGTLAVVQDDESMMHVQWSDRSLPAGSAPEEDMVIFPGEVRWP